MLCVEEPLGGGVLPLPRREPRRQGASGPERERCPTRHGGGLKDLEEFGLELPEKRLHKIKGTDLWELRSLWQQRIARSPFFEAGGRLLVVTTIFQKKEKEIPAAVEKRALERMSSGRTGGRRRRTY